MIKPKHLEKGDAVAIVSLSRGTLGEPWAIHKLDIARERLERDYGLKVAVMPVIPLSLSSYVSPYSCRSVAFQVPTIGSCC